ncbi:MAG: ATPase [Treponema sp.]|nr:ATPase [Treponema sp.]
MARTAQMKLVELMVLKEDISRVIEFIGKKESFQFQTKLSDKNSSEPDGIMNIDREFLDKLNHIKASLGLELEGRIDPSISIPSDEDRNQAAHLFSIFDELSDRIKDVTSEAERVNNAYSEALSFANLKVPYSELEHLSFLSMKIGKIDPKDFDALKEAVGGNGVIISLGEDKSHILAASSKKGRFAVDTELKNFNFINMEIPKDFNGVPDEVLEGLSQKKHIADSKVEEITKEKQNFADTHKEIISKLCASFAIGTQVLDVQNKLESTELVYRITGWVPAKESSEYMSSLDSITEGRIAIRLYEPYEVPAVMSGKEQVPVKLSHGKFVKSFERMIFSYGSPVYGTIDPTPFVAIFFTFLFGFMFGDFGQGLFIALFGVLMACKVVKVGGWNKFAPIFMGVGFTSSIMGLLTGECFSGEKLLEPFAEFVTGLFGTPRAPIIKMMPSSDPNSIKTMFAVFGVAIGVGFIINSVGLIINIVNNLIKKRYGDAFFGKTGLAGTLWFWYIIALVIRIAAFKHSIQVYDWIIIGITLFFSAFGEPFERLANGHRPVMENGFGAMLIGGVVELIEVISTYMSNTMSFIRVGAFALSHAVLGFLVHTLTEMVGGVVSPAGIIVMIIGNGIIIVLEGMIVAIQCIRLQYYEFFSKFYKETGREFVPFKFEY